MFHTFIDTASFSFAGEYKAADSKLLNRTVLKTRANSFEFMGKTYSKLYYGKHEIPDAYRYFDHGIYMHQRIKKPLYGADLANLQGRVIEYTIAGHTADRNASSVELLLVDLPNGRRGFLYNGSLFYLEKN